MNLPATGQEGDVKPRAAILRGWVPHVLAVAVLLTSFRHLYTLGTRYGFRQGVEYWLFRPNDNAPLVILVLGLWLLYRRSNRLRALPLQTASGWLILSSLFGGLAIFSWAIYTSAFDLQVFSLILLTVAIVSAYWGWAGVRAIWLPIVFLLFAVPLPAPLLLSVIFKLQIWTAQYTGWMLDLLSLPAMVSGDQILRATRSFQVIEGCSGMRSIQILTLLSVLLVDLFQRRGWHAGILILGAPFVAFALNGLRVLTLILNPHSEVVAIHNLQGIVILLVGLMVIYGVDILLERFANLNPGLESVATPPGRFAPGRALTVICVAVVATQASLLLGPVWQPPDNADPSLHTLVRRALDKWPSEKLDPDFLFRGSARFGEVLKREYFLDGGSVTVFVAESDYLQRGGSPLSPITALPGTGWSIGREEVEELPDGQRVDTRWVEKGKRRLLLRHWVLGSEGLLLETLRSLLALDRSPFARRESILVVRLETSLEDRRATGIAASERRLELVEERLEPVLALLRSSARAGGGLRAES
ncbi:MAG: exosortase/archaeosortase family protein [Myxococcota bacterium]